MTKDSPPPSASSIFMKLAPELRLQVYSYVLSASTGIPLRLHSELSETFWHRLDKSFPSINTALLRVNREIHSEALPTLYALNHFHWSVDDPYFLWPSQFSTNFAMMRHLSLEYRDEFSRMFMSSAADARDRSTNTEIARLIKFANTHATSLKTFTLYIASVPFGGAFFELFMNGRVAFELQEFLPRLERLSIVAFGTNQSYTALRAAVTPDVDWRSQVFKFWPMATLPTRYAVAMEARADEFAGESIRAWSTARLEFCDRVRMID